MHPNKQGLDARPVLVLNTCEERLQIVLGSSERLLLHQEWIVPSRTMGVLGPAVEQALKLLELAPTDLAGMACVRGPGSFTGIRIALSTALGFQAGCGVPLAGLDYLPLLARSAAPLRQGALTVLTYARKGLVYAQTFALPSCESLSDLAVLRPEQAAELIAALPPPRLCMGSALRRIPQLLELLNARECEILPSVLDHPSAEALLSTALEAPYAAEPVVPLYVRASDAEDNLPTFARQRGLTPEEARRLLEELTETPRSSL
jgi:tRNA threonylcarbamoyl adenosine modification protein YeaZ